MGVLVAPYSQNVELSQKASLDSTNTTINCAVFVSCVSLHWVSYNFVYYRLHANTSMALSLGHTTLRLTSKAGALPGLSEIMNVLPGVPAMLTWNNQGTMQQRRSSPLLAGRLWGHR